MKVSKIFAGMSALALAATMSVCASADDAPVENTFYNATGTWTAEYDGATLKAAVDNGAEFGENGDGTYTFGCNIQVGHMKNAKVTLEVTSTKNNIYNGADADPVNSAYMYTVQPSWQADAPADQEKHEVKFMYDDDGNPVMKKGAVDVNEWDSGPSKFNGQWAQFIMTDDDLDSITIKATIVADDATTWEYHPYDSEKTEEENVYIVFNFLASPSTVVTTVPSKEINAQIEGTDDSGDGSSDDGPSDDGSSDDGSSSDGSSDDGSSSDGSSSDGGSSKSGSGSNDNSSSGGSSNGGSSNGSSNGSTGGSGTTSGGSTSGGSASGGSTGSGTGAAGTSGGAATSEETGAETMALAGLALAGAAIVISKKK